MQQTKTNQDNNALGRSGGGGGGLMVWWHPRNEDVRDGRLYCFWRELIPVSGCAKKECVVSVVNAAAETLVAVLQAVVASPSLPFPLLPFLWFQVRAPHTFLSSGYTLWSLVSRALRRRCSRDGHFRWRRTSPTLE